jgi:hypothetical protein
MSYKFIIKVKKWNNNNNNNENKENKEISFKGLFQSTNWSLVKVHKFIQNKCNQNKLFRNENSIYHIFGLTMITNSFINRSDFQIIWNEFS